MLGNEITYTLEDVRKMLQLERGPSVSVCGKHGTCLRRLNSQPTAELPVSINSFFFFFFFKCSPIRTVIHLLFISSVALNDVNDLLWTVWESIWTLSDSIRHSLPALLERVNPLSSTLTDKAQPGFVLMYRSGRPWPFRCVCLCVLILALFWKLLDTACNWKAWAKNDKTVWVTAEPVTYNYMVWYAPGTSESTGSVRVCLLCLFPPELSALSQ